jgi:hypothetical protein
MMENEKKRNNNSNMIWGGVESGAICVDAYHATCQGWVEPSEPAEAPSSKCPISKEKNSKKDWQEHKREVKKRG